MPLSYGNLSGAAVQDYELANAQASINVKFSSAQIAANATGTQASGTLITGASTNVTVTSGGVAYSVTLPKAVSGLEIDVLSVTATNTIAVFPNTGDAINALSANAGLTFAALASATFICTVAGQWYTLPRVPS